MDLGAFDPAPGFRRLFYHLLNGIRHLMWDTGAMLELKPARVSGWSVVALSLVLTAIVWGGAL